MQKRFSFPPLPRTALAIAAAAALALSGCAGSSGSGTPAESYAASGQTGSPSNASSDAASEQARFDAFLAHQFQESVLFRVRYCFFCNTGRPSVPSTHW